MIEKTNKCQFLVWTQGFDPIPTEDPPLLFNEVLKEYSESRLCIKSFVSDILNLKPTIVECAIIGQPCLKCLVI